MTIVTLCKGLTKINFNNLFFGEGSGTFFHAKSQILNFDLLEIKETYGKRFGLLHHDNYNFNLYWRSQ